jgi:hypothetical protein
MATLKHFVTSSAPLSTASIVVRAARRLSAAAALALLLSGTLFLPGTAAAQEARNLSGTWQLSCPNRKGGVRQVTLRIQQNGSKLSGSFSGPRHSGKLSGSVQGSQVSLQIAGGARPISLTGTTDGNSMTVHTRKGVSCAAARQ